jgi:hypothetical protein
MLCMYVRAFGAAACRYEDMINDHAGAVRKIATHLGLDASDDLIAGAFLLKGWRW